MKKLLLFFVILFMNGGTIQYAMDRTNSVLVAQKEIQSHATELVIILGQSLNFIDEEVDEKKLSQAEKSKIGHLREFQKTLYDKVQKKPLTVYVSLIACNELFSKSGAVLDDLQHKGVITDEGKAQLDEVISDFARLLCKTSSNRINFERATGRALF